MTADEMTTKTIDLIEAMPVSGRRAALQYLIENRKADDLMDLLGGATAKGFLVGVIEEVTS